MIVSIDFDGTIADHKYPKIGKIKPGAVEAIKAIKSRGHQIIIFTCRAGKEEQEMREWLIMNGIPFDEINSPIEGFDLGSRKVYADVYIDDKGVRFNNNWEEISKWLG